MSTPSFLGISLRFSRLFHRDTASEATSATSNSPAATSTSVLSRSIVSRNGINGTGSVPLPQSRRKPLRQALAQLAPQQPRRRAARLLHRVCQIHKLPDILRHMPRGFLVQLDFFFQKWRIRPKVDADMALLLVGLLIKQRPK